MTKIIDRNVGEGYVKAHPELISAFMTTAAADFATLIERGIAEAEQVTITNVKTGEQIAWRYKYLLTDGRWLICTQKPPAREHRQQWRAWRFPSRTARQVTERRNVAGLVIADSIISARMVQPGGKKGQQNDLYGDGIPFGDAV